MAVASSAFDLALDYFHIVCSDFRVASLADEYILEFSRASFREFYHF